ncbi:MATE efflux family protein [Spirochaeta thermophila DSM 6578]|uniref:MATE efflux family protein n=1 Tax=Winmispira thermophila (strain ATCC 700085 / DSM 6578 / Z-1203) TaxID=869211 RepID=G0GG35_WINT7|nr:MATE family efflux transporter [Spirochaeta thermophila]AEJ62511.1 MATE efflux family protein [Spirochaeta thermophila DSM 6578]
MKWRAARGVLKRLSPHPFFMRRVWMLAFPIAIQNLLFSVLNMVDTFMIGQLGTEEVAGVALANQWYFVFFLFVFAIGSGAAIFTAQLWGKGDVEGVRRFAGIALIFALFIGAVFSIVALLFPSLILRVFTDDGEVIALGLSYFRWIWISYPFTAFSFLYGIVLRSTGEVALPFQASTIALAMNTVGNYLLIFGPGPFPRLGVEGAAIATVIARIFEAGYVLIAVYLRRTVLAARLRSLLSFSGREVRDYLERALPVVGSEVGWALGVSAYQAVFARVSTEAVAAYTLANTLFNFAVVVFVGTSNACSIMIGNVLGKGRVRRAQEYAVSFSLWAVLLGALSGLFLIAGSFLFPSFFRISPLAKEFLRASLVVVGVAMPWKIFNWHATVGIFRSGGDTFFGMLLELGGVWGVGVPIAVCSGLLAGLPFPVVLSLVQLEEVVKALAGVVRIRRAKWIRMVRGVPAGEVLISPEGVSS